MEAPVDHGCRNRVMVKNTIIASGNGVTKEQEDAGFTGLCWTKDLEKDTTISFVGFTYRVLNDIEVVQIIKMFRLDISRLRVHKLLTILLDKTLVDQCKISAGSAKPKLLVKGKEFREHLAQ